MDSSHSIILLLSIVLVGMCIYLYKRNNENFEFQLVSRMTPEQVKKANAGACGVATNNYYLKAQNVPSGSLFNSAIVPEIADVQAACGPEYPVNGAVAMKHPDFQLPSMILGGTHSNVYGN